MLLLFPFLLLLGLFLPGFFVAKCLRHEMWWASALLISLPILFHSVFWLGVFHVPIALWSVLPCLIAASGAAAWFARKSAVRKAEPLPPLPFLDRILLLSSGLVGAVLLARSAVSPLIGYDTSFRWDFLAQKILALGRFDFYPPLTPADFRVYFFVDGIPPLVSFTHWWLYASAGRYLPWLICIFVAAQFFCTLAYVYGAASALFSRRAGVLAAAILAGSTIYFKSVALGQETGLTALAIAAMIYFIVTARQPEDVGAMASAGVAAALCALSREYGWIAMITGVLALLWRRQQPKQIFLFAAVAASVAGPWYIRNWILTGNPLYSLRFRGFTVNPIHDGIMQYYNAVLGVGQWSDATWANVLGSLALLATLPILAGIPGAFKDFRRNGFLAVMALILMAVWLQAAGYTSGGFVSHSRVLSAALVVLSITAAGFLEPLTRPAKWQRAIAALVIVCQCSAAASGVLYPQSPFQLPLSQWPANAFRPDHGALESGIADQLMRVLPAGTRVLGENAYLYVALAARGIEVVPVWSPEVRFLFSSSPEDSERQLRALGIKRVAYYPNSLNTAYLNSTSPFYAAVAQRWRVMAQVPGFMYILAARDN